MNVSNGWQNAELAGLLIVPMNRLGFLQANWPNVLIGALALNWPLMMLWLTGPQLEFLHEAAIATVITSTIALSVLSFCITRWRNQGSVAPVLIAGIMSFLLLAIVGHTARGLKIDQALNASVLTAADISSITRGETFLLGEARISFETLVWRDYELFTLFPLVAHKRRDCIAQIISDQPDNPPRTIAWGIASIRLNFEDQPNCASHLAMTLPKGLLLQRIVAPSSFALKIVKKSLKSFPKSETTAPLILRVINPAILSTDLLIALLSVALIISNVALFHFFRQEANRFVPI